MPCLGGLGYGSLGLPSPSFSFRPAVWILPDHWLYESWFIFQILTCTANVDWLMDWLIDSWLRTSFFFFFFFFLLTYHWCWFSSMKRSQLLQYIDLWQLFTINKWYSWLSYIFHRGYIPRKRFRCKKIVM